MDLNIKTGTKPERHLQTIISELDTTVDDFFEKAKFALTELMEIATIHVDDTPDDRTRDLNRARMLADIAYDYLVQAQSVLEDITTREIKKEGAE